MPRQRFREEIRKADDLPARARALGMRWRLYPTLRLTAAVGEEREAACGHAAITREAHVRVVTWNCRVGAFRKKAAQVASLRADVIIVPECEDVRRELLLDGATQPTTRPWFGTAVTTRGVGVFHREMFPELHSGAG